MLKTAATVATLFGLLILGVWALPSSHDASALTGRWRFLVRLPETGTSTVMFTLQQDGERLSGTYEGSYGRVPIAGTLVGDRIVFSFTARDTEVTYRGTVGAREMEGVCDYGALNGEGTWTATRDISVF